MPFTRTCCKLFLYMTDVEPSLEGAGAALDRLVREHLDRETAVGLSVSIVQNGRLALLRQFGLAHRETGEPVTALSRFPIGSVSKQFTAAAILALAEDGKLSLDDSVGRFFPDLTRAADISVRALLNHTSGYPDWYPLDFIDSPKLQPTTIEDSRREYGRRPLDFEPGAYYSYSNTGYLIAACIVEKLTGGPFFDFLWERYLKPLGMDQTSDYRQDDPSMVGRYGRYFAGPIERVPTEANGWLTGAGGLVSTAEDLAKWNTALLSGAVLSEESWRQMSGTTTLADGRLSWYGLGLARSHRHGHTLTVHRGGVSGAVAENVLVQELGLAITWFSNLETAALWPITAAVLDELIPEEKRLDVKPPVYNATRTIQVQGPPPEYAAAVLYRDIVEGTLDRSGLTPGCGEYLAEDRLASRRERLTALGEPLTVGLVSTSERAGMQLAELRFEFARGPQRALLGRLANGTVAEFMFQD